MANNRLFIVDRLSGDSIMFAKGFDTWQTWANPGEQVESRLDAWLEQHDIASACGNDATGLVLMTEAEWIRHRETTDGEHT